MVIHVHMAVKTQFYGPAKTMTMFSSVDVKLKLFSSNANCLDPAARIYSISIFYEVVVLRSLLVYPRGQRAD